MKENTSVSEEIKDVKKGEISEYEVIYNGYISNFESKIIKNVDEYNSLKEDSTLDNIAKEKLDSNKYDDTYFNEKSLAFIYITTYDITGKLILIEVDKDIFIFDAGLKYADDKMLGVDYIIPNYDYLKENEN